MRHPSPVVYCFKGNNGIGFSVCQGFLQNNTLARFQIKYLTFKILDLNMCFIQLIMLKLLRIIIMNFLITLLIEKSGIQTGGKEEDFL